jgi:two-component system response regulator NreC
MLPLFRLAPVPDSGPATALGQITIVLADDHAAMRESLRTLLDGEADLRVIAETDSLRAVMRHVRSGQPDVLVLDLGVSGSGSGLNALDRLQSELPGTRMVVLTANDDPGFAKGALESGALGLVLKDMADSDLPAAVRAASRGQRYVSPQVASARPGAGDGHGGDDGREAGQDRGGDDGRGDDQDRGGDDDRGAGDDRLTPREREVLRLIALGHTSVEIAAKLGLSPRTIETHRARIHRKLSLTTRAELVRYALRRGMLKE